MRAVLAGNSPLRGEISVPGDKSISHRAVIFGALARGITEISGFLDGEDCLSTISCLRQLGVPVEREGKLVSVTGVGLRGLREPAAVLDAGNSGTTARLLLGVLAGQPFYSVVTGDDSLRNRPMARIAEPLLRMGANIRGRGEGTLLPFTIWGGELKPLVYNSPVASAQVKSAVLLAGLFAEGITVLTEPKKSRDHSERMLKAFGARLRAEKNSVFVEGQPQLAGREIHVPGDISSAAFFLVAASVVPGSDLLVRNVGINPTRTGILDVLAGMGADLTVENRHEESGEPVADIRIRSSRLSGVEIAGDIIPRLIDELPVLAVAAMFAEGQTVVRDARELRVKETDRIAALTEELTALGAAIFPTDDGFIIEGGRAIKGENTKSHGDHRIAMSLCVAALRASSPVRIYNAECVNISFPHFFDTLKTLGQEITLEDH